MKKDIIISTMRIIIGLALISYVSYLGYNHINILSTKNWNNNIIILSIVGILGLSMIIGGIIKPCFKKPRTTQVIIGLIIILFPSYSGIVDNYVSHAYLGDILRLLGVIITILGTTKICIYDSCIKKTEKKQMEEMEIIEV